MSDQELLANVLRVEQITADTRLLSLEAEQRIGFHGGQFIIIDSGRLRADGTPAKRAYTPLSSDEEQRRFQLAVKAIPDGTVSRFMHQLAAGDRISFSGPLGKFRAAEEPSGETLVLATDTGITAVLGLIRSVRFRSRLARTRFIWLRSSPDYFVSDHWVRSVLPSELLAQTIGPVPCVGHPQRLEHVRSVVRRVLDACRVHHAFIAGDGAVNYGLFEDFAHRGVSLTRDHVESFFNSPPKSA